LEDLADYQIKIRKPVKGTYRGYTVLSVPPASSGGTHLVQMLNIMENFDVAASVQGSAANAHLWPKPSDGPSPTGPDIWPTPIS